MTLTDIQREQMAIRRWQGAVAEAALPFERRRTVAALKRVDPDIHRRLIAQRSLFDQRWSPAHPKRSTTRPALCRGGTKAIQDPEAAAEPDDGYMWGQDMRSGFRVAVGQQKAVAQRDARYTAKRWFGLRRTRWRRSLLIWRLLSRSWRSSGYSRAQKCLMCMPMNRKDD